MKTTVQTLVSTLLATTAASLSAATYNYKLVDSSGNETTADGISRCVWTQGGSDFNWTTAGNWADGNIGTNGAYAIFGRTDASSVTLTDTRRATGIIIEEGAGPVTLTAGGQNGLLGLRRNGDKKPNIINLSSNPITVDVPVFFTYGSGTVVGVMPGVVFKKKVDFDTTGVAQFNLFDGDTSLSEEMRTTVFEGPVTHLDKFYHLPNHRVVLEGEKASFSFGTYNLRGPLVVNGGSLAFGSMVLNGNGNPSITLNNATIKTTQIKNNYDGYNFTFTVTGALTIDTTGGDCVLGEVSYGADANALTLTGGGSFAVADGVDKLFDSVTVMGDAMTLISWPLAANKKMTLMPSAAPTAGDTVSFLTLNNATAATYAGSFQLAPSAADSAQTAALKNGAAIQVVQNGDDAVVQIVYSSFVTQKTDNKTWDDVATWDPEGAAEAGKNYLVSGSFRLNTPGDPTHTTVFPGDSLTVVGNTAASQAYVAQKSRTNTIERLYFGAWGTYHFQNWNGGNTALGQTLKGNVYVSSETAGKAAYFKTSHANPCRLEANISGDGELRFVTLAGNNYDFDLTISGDNSQYFGKMIFDRLNENKHDIVTIASAEALGGNPATELVDGVRLNDTVLKITDDVTFTATNRIWTIYRNSSIDVADEKTVTIPSATQYVVDGTDVPSLTKKGAGTLVLSGAVKSAASGTTFTVSEGALAIKNANALVGISSVSFAEGTTLIVPMTGIGENGFLLANNAVTSLPRIEFDVGDYTEPPTGVVPLFSMVKGDGVTLTSEDVRSAVIRPFAGYQVSVTADEAEVGGVAYVRFSAKMSKRFVVIIR